MTTHPLLRSTPIDEGDKARSLGLALGFIAGFAVLLGGLQIVGAVFRGDVLWPVLLFTAAFLVWIAAGIAAWWVRPANRIGPLLLGGGGAVFLGGLGNIGGPSLSVVGAVFATTVLAVAVHLLLAYPVGRVRGVLSAATVILAYVVALGLQFVRVAIPPDLIEPFVVVTLVQRWLGLVVLVVLAAILVTRMVRAPRESRRGLVPVSVFGLAVAIVVPLIPTMLGGLDIPSEAVGTIQLAVSTALPILFLIGVLLGRPSEKTA
jgi:hypothetical protein